jgi:hypothetical protein
MAPVGEQRQWKHLEINPWGETPKLELTANAAWGEHCRKEALAHIALID